MLLNWFSNKCIRILKKKKKGVFFFLQADFCCYETVQELKMQKNVRVLEAFYLL